MTKLDVPNVKRYSTGSHQFRIYSITSKSTREILRGTGAWFLNDDRLS